MKTTEPSPIDGMYQEETLRSFDELEKRLRDLGKKEWMFRGDRCADWRLETSFERALRGFDLRNYSRSWLEASLLRQFQRRAHHYLVDVPERDNWLEWMALMRHHGAPTRLLDWTYSCYVALFMGLERANRSCAIWAIDAGWVAQQARKLRLVSKKAWDAFVERDRHVENAKTFKGLFARRPDERKPFVVAVNPFRLNERLSIQQGVFLCPGDISKSFEANLAGLFKNERRPSKYLRKYIFRFTDVERQRAIEMLIRMNLTSTSLYPGLDGFARSLALALARPDVLDPGTTFPAYKS